MTSDPIPTGDLPPENGGDAGPHAAMVGAPDKDGAGVLTDGPTAATDDQGDVAQADGGTDRRLALARADVTGDNRVASGDAHDKRITHKRYLSTHHWCTVDLVFAVALLCLGALGALLVSIVLRSTP